MGRPDPFHDAADPATQPTRPQRGRASAARRPLLQLLQDLQQALQARFDDYDRATSRPFSLGEDGGPGSALRRLQLGLALLCKLEEQLLHPALSEGRAFAWPALDRVRRDVVALRDLSTLLDRAAPLHRTVVVAMLEGLARLHFSALDTMLREADGAALPWSTLERETRALLRRWQAEPYGCVGDEACDPGGAPPR